MLIVGIGGTTSPTSSSDRALRRVMDEVSRLGADTRILSGGFLRTLPLYDPTARTRTPEAVELVEALRGADGLVISSAAYHGSISGMLKNALDYTEDMAADDAVYLSGRPVGVVTVAQGWQAGVTTLGAVRAIVHALRGWPTPYGCVINTATTAPGGLAPMTEAAAGLSMVAAEVVHAARMFTGSPAPVLSAVS
ncbi:MAG: NADPH-dependent reductase family protein [Nocardioidaceae bacterium]|nr:NADPH-dependent reductase family protein [Nocardioidaceae bacterium]